MRKVKIRILLPLLAVLAVVIAFLLWASAFYHADETAAAAMQTDEKVIIEKTGAGWLFDGPSNQEALIFYPGAKVDEKAYAPLLHRLAEEEMDVYLVKMPLHLAFFGMNRAGEITEESAYDHYYIGGHSLGGAMAAAYAEKHENDLAGIILLAAYPTKETRLDTLLIYGSEDGVLNMERVQEAQNLVSGQYRETVINGGNHAQFGNYGDQAGDGKAAISPSDQQEETLEQIREFAR